MDVIKYIDQTKGDREGNAIVFAPVTGHPVVLTVENNTSMVALSGKLDTRFDEINYYNG